MYNRLIFCSKKQFINRSQTWFREKKSTEPPHQTLVGTIQEAMDRGLHAIGLFLDLAEAYDVINHDTLLDELPSYDIRSETNLWIKSYLTHHVQFVEINQTGHRNYTEQIYFLMQGK
jgi:hypothetical protein